MPATTRSQTSKTRSDSRFKHPNSKPRLAPKRTIGMSSKSGATPLITDTSTQPSTPGHSDDDWGLTAINSAHPSAVNSAVKKSAVRPAEPQLPYLIGDEDKLTPHAAATLAFLGANCCGTLEEEFDRDDLDW